MSFQEHKASAPVRVRCAVITVSDTRTIENDTGGQSLIELAIAAGHVIVQRDIIPDDPPTMIQILTSLDESDDVDAILMTGGTGITKRDQTYETVTSLLAKEIPGYGELFRRLSYDQIGPAAMLSRAVGGRMRRTLVLTMPGSPAAVKLAMEKIILPEIGHLLREARR